MDSIVDLPPFMGYTDILVTVDRFSKAAHMGFYGRKTETSAVSPKFNGRKTDTKSFKKILWSISSS